MQLTWMKLWQPMRMQETFWRYKTDTFHHVSFTRVSTCTRVQVAGATPAKFHRVSANDMGGKSKSTVIRH